MDNGDKDNWIAPILFGVAALSIYGITRISNQNQEQPMDEKTEFAALMNYSHAIHDKLDKFLIENAGENIIIPQEYLDPLTHQLMEDPVLLSDNQTYNRKTALLLIKYKKESPISPPTPLLEGCIEDNTQLKVCIESWLAALNLQYEKNFKIRL